MRIRQDGIDERCNNTDSFSRRRQHAGLQRRVIRFRTVGRTLPWRVGGQVAVSFGNEIPEQLQSLREVEFVEQRTKLGDRSHGVLAQHSFSRSLRARFRHNSTKVLVQHVHDAAHEVSVAVGKVAIEALHQCVKRKIAVLPKGISRIRK